MATSWDEVGALFAAGVDLDPSSRDEFVKRQASDTAIAGEVLRLLRLNDEACDFLEEPVIRLLNAAPPLFAMSPGELIADRFEIIESLGRGGMGEVYAAHDRVLKERVAVKLMRADAGPATVMATRLRTEVQIARRITHRGVCRVHDVAFHRPADSAPVVALIMELLDGETLATRLARGPMSMDESTRIAGQLADALDAAHAVRVLHRDIKPENVMLVPGEDGPPRAVLMDFGLAGLFRQDDPATDTGPAASFGTPAYMSPELIAGGAPSVQSDIYAFALVLRDVAAGRRHNGAPEHDLSALPAQWRRGTARALDSDPAKRFTSAGALVAALTRSGPIRRLRSPFAVALVTGLVALSFAIFRFNDRRLLQLAEGATVLVTDVHNDTGDDRIDGVSEVLRSQLALSSQFTPLSPLRVADTLRAMQVDATRPMTMEILREAALRQGASLVIQPSVRSRGQEYQFELTVERVGSRPSVLRNSWRQAFPAPTRDGLFSAVHDAAMWMRTLSGEAPESLADHDRPPHDTTTSSWEALRLFARADREQANGRSAAAVLLLDEAVRFDAGFAAAQMRRADILIGLKREREGYEAWKRAIDLSAQHQLSNREQLRIRALYLDDIGDFTAAEAAYRTYLVQYPADADATFRLASTLVLQYRMEESIAQFERALTLRPDWLVTSVHLATAYLDAGRFKEAADRIAALRQMHQPEHAAWLDSLTAFAQGDLDGALSALEPIAQSTDPVWQSRLPTLRAAWLVEAGQPESAESILRDGIAADLARGLDGLAADKWLHIGDLRLRASDRAGAVDASERALVLAANPQRLQVAGAIFARTGAMARAKETLAALANEARIPRVEAAADRLRGEIARAERRPTDAVRFFERASAVEPRTRNRISLAQALFSARLFDRAAGVVREEVAHPVFRYRSPEPQALGMRRDALAMQRQLVAHSQY